MRLSFNMGRLDLSYLIDKAISLLLNPTGAYYTMEDIKGGNPGLLTGLAFVVIVAEIEAIGTILGLLLTVQSLLGPFSGMAGPFLGRAILGAVIIGPIIAVVGWLIITLISYVIGRVVRGEPVELLPEQYSTLAVMFAFASAPEVIMIIPWLAAGTTVNWIISILVGAWSYYYTWTAARVMFEVDEVKAAVITVVQLLLLLWSIISLPWATTSLAWLGP